MLFGLVIKHGPQTDVNISVNGRKWEAEFTEFHEKTGRRRTTWPSVCPENDVIFVRIVPTFEEVEEEMLWADVNVAGIRAFLSVRQRQGCIRISESYILDPTVTEVRFLDARTPPRKCRMRKRREMLGSERREFQSPRTSHNIAQLHYCYFRYGKPFARLNSDGAAENAFCCCAEIEGTHRQRPSQDAKCFMMATTVRAFRRRRFISSIERLRSLSEL